MPVNTDLTSQVWGRYAYLRDNGHHDFVLKADICEAFFRGDQWADEDLAVLRAQRRPALTINKIISTVSNMMGEQIYNRSEISFRPRGDANAKTANTLAKVWKYVSDRNQLDWKRSDMFTDGIITSRGFLDMRMDYSQSTLGNIEITKLNPKNVLIDMDADDADPETWSELFVTKWCTIDEIEILYGKANADILRAKDGQSSYPYGWDSLDYMRDRFGDDVVAAYGVVPETQDVRRNIRVIDRQHRKLSNQKHFVDQKTGQSRPVPEAWDAVRASNVAAQYGLTVVKRLVRRIRWSTIADNVELHDDWSPYKRFTVIPFFPQFRHGRTIGSVENLLGPQEMLNKTSSQELHIVNGTANSGWKIKSGSLTNMSTEELEEKGAQSGLVLELTDISDAEKITPNSTPSGLDRLSYKAEEHIKSISGVTDTMQGNDREDVAAKAIDAKKKNSSTTMAKPLDSLARSDHWMARQFIDLVQEFMTGEQVLTIVADEHTGATEKMTINGTDPTTGEILNDMSLGEYDVVVGSTPVRETLEDSQFDQAMAMKEAGIQVPDSFIISSSRLMKKQDLIKQLQDASNSPEAQQQKALQMQQLQAEVAKLNAEVQQIMARAALDGAKSQHQQELTTTEASTPIEQPQAQVDPQQEMQLKQQQAEHAAGLKEQEAGHKMQLGQQAMDMKQQESQQKMQLAAQAQADKAVTDRLAAAHKAKAERETAAQPKAKK